jgi:hypothetical protein
VNKRLKKGDQPGTIMIEVEKGDLVRESYSVLAIVLEVEMTIEKPKGHKSPGFDQIPAELQN